MFEEVTTKDLLNFVKDMGTNFSYECAQNGKIFMFHVDAHQRTSAAEETFCNMDKIKCSVDISHPDVCLTDDVQSGHVCRDGSGTQAQQHGLPLIKADLATVTAKGLTCQQQSPTLSSGMADSLSGLPTHLVAS